MWKVLSISRPKPSPSSNVLASARLNWRKLLNLKKLKRENVLSKQNYLVPLTAQISHPSWNTLNYFMNVWLRKFVKLFYCLAELRYHSLEYFFRQFRKSNLTKPCYQKNRNCWEVIAWKLKLISDRFLIGVEL